MAKGVDSAWRLDQIEAELNALGYLLTWLIAEHRRNDPSASERLAQAVAAHPVNTHKVAGMEEQEEAIRDHLEFLLARVLDWR